MRLPEEQKKDALQPQDRAAQDLPAALRGWLDDATGQMRWKRARPVAARELADHLTDQYEAFLDEGMDEDEAAQATASTIPSMTQSGRGCMHCGWGCMHCGWGCPAIPARSCRLTM